MTEFVRVNFGLYNKLGDALPGCWWLKLVLQRTGSLTYAVDELDIIAQLQARYPTYTISRIDGYDGYTVISIRPPTATPPEYLQHLIVDLLPGRYLAFARACFLHNEWSNVVMFCGRCDDEICVPLMFNAATTCAHHAMHPALDRIINVANLPVEEKVIDVRGLLIAANLSKAALQAELATRLAEATAVNNTELMARIANIQTVVAQVTEGCY